MGSVKCSVQMFLFFLHNYKSYLLLSVCLMGCNLGRLFKGWELGGVCVWGGGGGGGEQLVSVPLSTAVCELEWSCSGVHIQKSVRHRSRNVLFHPVIYSIFFPPASSQMRGLGLRLGISCCTVKD